MGKFTFPQAITQAEMAHSSNEIRRHSGGKCCPMESYEMIQEQTALSQYLYDEDTFGTQFIACRICSLWHLLR